MSRMGLNLYCLILGIIVATTWADAVDDHLVGNLKAAAVISSENGHVWAKSPGMQIKKDEGEKLVNLYKSPKKAMAKGFNLGGVNYHGIKAGYRSIYGGKGSTAVKLTRTGQAILIGVYDRRY